MAMAPERIGIGIHRHFTSAGTDPFDTVRWERRDARITNYLTGAVAFEQLGVEVPSGWSVNATNILAQKYFRGTLGAAEREWSLKQVTRRVVDTITAWGAKDGYFVDDDEAEAFRDELTYLIIHQRAAFNSPVWFNIGVKGVPQQASACQPYDALVCTEEGLRPIGELVGTGAVGTKVFDARGLTSIVAVKSNGRRPVLRVHTRAGFRLDVTPDHLVWRASGDGTGAFVLAAALKPGDQLTWHRTEAFGVGEITSTAVAEAALAGWLQADGFVGHSEGTNWSQGIEALTVTPAELAWVTKALDVVYPEVHRHGSGVVLTDPRSDCHPTRLYGHVLADLVDRWDLGIGGTDMAVPPALLTAPLPVVAAYLRSLYQAEGYVSTRARTAQVGLDMISVGLVRGIQGLLGRFGIFGQVRSKAHPRTNGKGCWSISIQDAGDRRRFADEIGFVDPIKAAELEASFEIPGHGAGIAKRLEVEWIEPLGEMDVYDIQTESGEYLSGNLRVHNCFILSVDDSMSSILNWYVEEGTIFKGGSGSGINLSRIRSSKEGLRGGGTASGPVSFMRGADASAGTIKSGGKTRRAAKMVILDVDHPDIEDFIWCKAVEERKARALRDAGFDMDLDGKDSHSIQYQNANNSVRVTDEFMEAVLDDADWELKSVTTGEALQTVKARALFRQICKAAWECADPGMQFDTTINRWHTAPKTGRINASNPCSEYMHLDDSACNLASLNLLTFLEEDSSFDVEGFRTSTEVIFTAQEILVGNADYPTKAIGETSRRFRQLGIGYANLGALLMAQGVPYDSDEGRAWAATITALLTGHSYATSARTAARMGPFAGFTDNRDAMLNVIRMHRDEVAGIDEELVPPELLSAAQEAWDAAVEVGEQYGVRNSQASVLAPTGTIGLLMDCDTTGIEPDLGLVKTKKLVGGGTMSIVNQTVPRALRRLGYDPSHVDAIIAYIDEHKSILGAPALKAEHLPVFACSMGDNTIHYRGHVRMMGAVQPFISGAISKCVTGDTLLSTAEGLIRIGTLYRGEEPDSFRADVREVASLSGPQKTDAFYFGGVRPVTSVVLRSGHRVSGTANHRLLVSGRDGLEWRRLDEIAVGEYVATQYGDDLWSVLPARLEHARSTSGEAGPSSNAPAAGSRATAGRAAAGRAVVPAEMSADLAFVLGAYAASGRIPGGGWAVQINSDVRHVLDRLAESVERVFGVTGSIRQPGGGLAGARIEFRSQAIVELFDDLGCGQCAVHKRIPDAVLRSPRDMVLAYLQGLSMAADVTMCGTAKWAMTSESPGLLDDLQAVLTNLGVVHERSTRYHKSDGRPYDEVSAVGEQAHDLLTMVPFLDPHKAAYAQALQALGRHPNRNGADVVPGISPYELYRIVPRSMRSDFSYLADPRAMCVSRRSLEQVAALAGPRLPQWLRHVLEDNLHFSPVESVGSAGEREVFDLSVPTTQAFVGNGIVNHNTVNLPEEATLDEVEQLHIEAWQLGLKAVAIYRDNCKVGQPLATTKRTLADPETSEAEAHDAELALKVAELEKALQRQTVVVKQPVRERLPRRRKSMTFKFRVADCEGYVTVGEYDDGRPGEVFMQVSKQGSTLAGIMDAFAVAVSLGLQHGVPLATFVKKYTNMRFEPAGMTDDRELRIASSLVDYIFRRLAVDYLTFDERAELGILTTDERLQPTLPGVEEVTTPSSSIVEEMTEDRAAAAYWPKPPLVDAPFCHQCGIQMQRSGSCFACGSCGSTSGCS